MSKSAPITQLLLDEGIISMYDSLSERFTSFGPLNFEECNRDGSSDTDRSAKDLCYATYFFDIHSFLPVDGFDARNANVSDATFQNLTREIEIV